MNNVSHSSFLNNMLMVLHKALLCCVTRGTITSPRISITSLQLSNHTWLDNNQLFHQQADVMVPVVHVAHRISSSSVYETICCLKVQVASYNGMVVIVQLVHLGLTPWWWPVLCHDMYTILLLWIYFTLYVISFARSPQCQHVHDHHMSNIMRREQTIAMWFGWKSYLCKQN